MWVLANSDYYYLHKEGYRFADRPWDLTRIQQKFIVYSEKFIMERQKEIRNNAGSNHNVDTQEEMRRRYKQRMNK